MRLTALILSLTMLFQAPSAAQLLDMPAGQRPDPFSLKSSNPDGFKALQNALGEELARRHGGGPGKPPVTCFSEDEARLQASYVLAGLSPSAEAMQRSREMADRAIAGLPALEARYFAGQDLSADGGGGMAYQRAFVDDIAKATTSVEKELFQRQAKDQFHRTHFAVIQAGVGWAAGFDQPAKAYAQTVVGAATCPVDRDNTAWLKAHVQANGWFRKSRDGARAGQVGWLLVQHADRDPAFQAEVLRLMEELLPAEEVSAQNYAYLYDRVAVAAKRPQRYATQGDCKAGSWEPMPLENPADIDNIRKSVGMGTLAQYKTMFVGMCPAA
jgi:hypothetical protein